MEKKENVRSRRLTKISNERAARGAGNAMMNPEIYFHEAKRLEQEEMRVYLSKRINHCEFNSSGLLYSRKTLRSGCILYEMKSSNELSSIPGSDPAPNLVLR